MSDVPKIPEMSFKEVPKIHTKSRNTLGLDKFPKNPKYLK